MKDRTEEAMYARDQLVLLAKRYDQSSDVYRIINFVGSRIITNYIHASEPIIEPKSVRGTINNFRDVVKQMEDHGTNPDAVRLYGGKIRDFRDTKVLNRSNREELEELLLRLKFVESW